jgi:xylan 1,4-beta-xylosidase
MPEEVDVLASRDEDGTVAVLLWRHTDDQYQVTDQQTPVEVTVTGLDASRYSLRHLRVDATHSNAHTVWLAVGSPQDPTPEQLGEIHRRQGLEELEPVRELSPSDSAVVLSVPLPLPAMSLLVLTPLDPSAAPRLEP